MNRFPKGKYPFTFFYLSNSIKMLFTKKTKKVELFSAPQSAAQTLIISMSLIYLAIPNILFLWGWFKPWVALSVTSLIIFAVGRAIVLSVDKNYISKIRLLKTLPSLLVGGVVVLFVSLYFLIWAGILGFVHSFGDLEILRNALYTNLRDDAWPLILPNGKQMSYYLANVLPAALLGRMMPGTGQLGVVIWTLPAILLAISMVASLIRGTFSRGWKLVLAALMLSVFSCLYADPKLWAEVAGLSIPKVSVIFGHSLKGVGGVYNSYPPALLLAAMLMICRKRADVVLPTALALVVPLTPAGGVGLLPFVLVRWWASLQEKKALHIIPLLASMMLPAAMVVICAVYFLRADGQNAVSLSGVAWPWKHYVVTEVVRICGWITLALPLFLYVKRDAFFVCYLCCNVLTASVFIGTMPEAGAGLNNELWLKTAPCYMLMTAAYWLRSWASIGIYKYVVLLVCLVIAVRDVLIFVPQLGTNGYLEVNDRWNGHLNHDAVFFYQSVPPCKKPFLDIMLKESGESERSFPGCLLPKAPGCDYSRPSREETPLRW